MTVADLSVIVKPSRGNRFRATVCELTNDAVDVRNLYVVEVDEREALDAFPGSPAYSASMAFAAREACRRHGYNGRLIGAYAGHNFVFVGLDARGDA